VSSEAPKTAPSDHPLADIMGAIEGLRDLVQPIPQEMRHLGTRMGKLEDRQEAAERKADRAETVATGASRRVSELESKHDDVTRAMSKHVDSLVKTSKDLVTSSEEVAKTSKALVHSNEHVVKSAERVAVTSGELVVSNTKQNVELDRQTSLLVSIKRWTPVLVAIGALLGAVVGAGVSAYYQAKAFAPMLEGSHHAP
jgi:chromosome segregation ATPase